MTGAWRLALGAWGVRWLEPAPEHLDPYPVLWAMCRSADPAAHGDAEVCVHSPGEGALVVVADPAAFTRWHMGRTTWARAVRAGHIAVTGPSGLARP